jgi:hypothetical protein
MEKSGFSLRIKTVVLIVIRIRRQGKKKTAGNNQENKGKKITKSFYSLQFSLKSRSKQERAMPLILILICIGV